MKNWGLLLIKGVVFVLLFCLIDFGIGRLFILAKDKGLEKGCTCTTYEEGETSTDYISPTEMMGYGASTCSALASALQGAYLSHGINASVNCQ